MWSTIQHILKGYYILKCLTLQNETSRKLSEAFNMYTDIDEGFIRTRIPVKEACLSEEPVARSQAQRICNRLDEFKEVILDFNRVEVMGQGFADEIFPRMYAFPEIYFIKLKQLFGRFLCTVRSIFKKPICL